MKNKTIRIKNLSARNIAGRNIDATFAPVTVIAGGNFKGKTTHINALALALYSYVPGVAKKPNEVFERLATGNPLTVRAECDDGRVFGGEWAERRGSVSFKATDDSKAVMFPPVMLDANEYFALSGPERVKMLFARSNVELTVDAVARSIVTNAKNIKLEPHTDTAEAAVQKLVTLVSGRALADKSAVQTWIENVVAEVKASKLLAEQNERRLSATLAGLTQTATTEASADPASEGKLVTARKELEAATAEHARVEQVLKDLKQLERELSAAAARRVDMSVLTTQHQELQEQLDGELAVPAPPTFASAPNAQEAAAIERAAKAIDELVGVAIGPRPTDDAERAAQTEAIDKANTLDRATHAAKAECDRIEKLMDEAEHVKTCPTCGQSVAGKNAALVEGYREQLAAEQAKWHESKAASDAFKTAPFIAAANDARARGAAWDKAQSDLRAAQTKLADLHAASERRCRNEWNKLFADHQEAQARARGIQKQCEDIARQISSDANAEAARAEEKLPGVRQSIDTTQASLLTAANRVTAAHTAVGTLEVAVRRLTQERASAADRARASEAADTAKAERDVFKLAVDMLAELQATILDRAVLPLLASCNDLCRDILEAPLAYRDGEIGMERPTGFVSYRTMSGSERAVSFCALSLALAAGSPMRLAVIDELGRLDSVNRAKVVTNVLAMVRDGKLDQAVFVDTNPDFYEMAFDAEIKSGELMLIRV